MYLSELQNVFVQISHDWMKKKNSGIRRDCWTGSKLRKSWTDGEKQKVRRVIQTSSQAL